jgi:hypothetical protein
MWRGFVETVRAVAPVRTPAGGALMEGEGHRSPGQMTVLLVGAGFALVVGAIVALSLLYSPGPPKYTLTAGSLKIRDLFYPARVNAGEVEVGQIRVVDLDTDGDWRPTERTNGFANSHYDAGWFRVANGQKVRLYRASGRRLVLLPGKGSGVTVLLEVNEPDAFVVELRREWGR